VLTEIGNEAHKSGSDPPSRRGEALIASESLAKCCVADEAKTDGRNCQPQEPAGNTLEYQRGQHQRETRPKCNDQRAGRNHCGTKRDSGALRSHGVEQFTAGSLTQQAGEPC